SSLGASTYQRKPHTGRTDRGVANTDRQSTCGYRPRNSTDNLLVDSHCYLPNRPNFFTACGTFFIVVALDISPLYLRLAPVAIPFPFGFALLWFSHTDVRWSILDGIFAGLFSAGGMLAVVALVDNVPLLPQSLRDWRETLEYVASIALATVTGSGIAILVRRMLPRTLDSTRAPTPAAITIARTAGRHVGTPALRRRAQKIQDNFGTIATAAAALAAGAGSIYTGVRALLGGS